MVIGGILWIRFLRWYYGQGFAALIQMDGGLTSLRNNARPFRSLAITLAVLMTVLNCLSFKTLLQVDQHSIRYGNWLALKTTERNVQDIEEVILHHYRRAPNGNILRTEWLEVVFRDGWRLDTYYLVETEHIQRLLGALLRAAGPGLRIERNSGQGKPGNR